VDTVEQTWVLKFYVKSFDSQAEAEFARIKYICAEHLPIDSVLEVVDLSENILEQRMQAGNPLPMLVRVEPKPGRRIFCDFTDVEQILHALGVTSPSSNPASEK